MKQRLSRPLARAAGAAGFFLLLASYATPVAAHDNLGGDEMSMALTIFMVGMTLILGASLAVLWAWKTGQFGDVERAKYTMLENADDLDALPIYPPPAPSAAQGGRHAPK